MTSMIRLAALRRSMVRGVAAAGLFGALGGAAVAAPPPGGNAGGAGASMGGVPGSPDAYDPAGTPAKPVTGVHEMGGGGTGRGVDVDPVSPGGVGSGISTNSQPSAVGGAGSVGSSTTASPTSR
ncbi:MAG: hypothetical protein ACRYG6_04440 [Janthinobacterium lividum]